MSSRDRDDEKEREKKFRAINTEGERPFSKKKKKREEKNDHVWNRVSEEKAVETCHNKIYASV